MARRRAGLCTIADKDSPLSEVIRIAADTDAAAIEVWGQPPHIDYPLHISAIEDATKIAANAGIEIAALGSYFQPGKSTEYAGIQLTAKNQVEIAEAFGARLIRVWCGAQDYEESTPSKRNEIYEEIRRFADTAGASGIGVVLERHGNSLTHGWSLPETVLKEIGHPNVSLNYQIPYPAPVKSYAAKSVDDYTRLLPLSKHAHLQNYLLDSEGNLIRTQLADGIIDYSELGNAARVAGYEGYFMVEFAAESRGALSFVESIASDIAYIESLF